VCLARTLAVLHKAEPLAYLPLALLSHSTSLRVE
jgi:hypothetical protein